MPWEDITMRIQSYQFPGLSKFTLPVWKMVGISIRIKAIITQIPPHNYDFHSYPYVYPIADFQNERRTLLEVVGPELQSVYDDRQIEVSIVLLEMKNSKHHLNCNAIPMNLNFPTDWDCRHPLWNGARFRPSWYRSVRSQWPLNRNKYLSSSF